MTNEEILQKAIEKACKNGYGDGKCNSTIEWITEKDEQWGTIFTASSLESLIYSHAFAKAFFGEEICDEVITGQEEGGYLWQYHLQQMVISDDPIRYLEQYL